MQPPITLTAQPLRNGQMFFLPIAPRRRNDPQSIRIVVGLRIRNASGTEDVTLSAVRFSFPGSAIAAIDMHEVPVALDPIGYDDNDDGLIPAGREARWSNGVVDGPDNHVFLPADNAPARLRIEVGCDGYDEPVALEFDLVPFVDPVAPGEGAFRLPFAAGDFEHGEYLVGSALHWANGQGAGTQIMAHDLGVEKRGSWSALLDGEDGTENDHYRIWGMPVRALADGEVISWENDVDDNPKPGEKISTVANHFWIRHGETRVLYTHLQKGSLTPSLLQQGAAVEAGQRLGLAGNSGRSSHPHLHLEARDDATNTLRGLPFRDALVLDPAEVGDDTDAPWFELLNHGLSREKVAVKHKPPRRRRPWRAVDLLSILLPAHVYEIFHLPDPTPDEMLEQLARQRVNGLRADRRAAAREQARRLGVYVDALQKALARRGPMR